MNETSQDVFNTAMPVFDRSVVRAFHDRLDEPVSTDDVLAEVRALEEAKNAITARQARLAVALHAEQRDRDIPRGINAAETARVVGSHIALARRSSPHLGSKLLGLAHAVVEEMPHSYQALTAGVISEWDATGLCQETACLTRDDRAAVDAAIAADLGQVSHGRLIKSARDHAYRLDPAAFTRRRANAEIGRRVSLRPAPDSMTWLTALLPVKDGVACYAALNAAAKSNPQLPRGQVMADTLVERITGRTPADGVDIHVNLIMPLDTLTGDTPAYVPGYGPIPADLARHWVAGDYGKNNDGKNDFGKAAPAEATEPNLAEPAAADQPRPQAAAPSDPGQPETGQPDTGQPDTGQPDTTADEPAADRRDAPAGLDGPDGERTRVLLRRLFTYPGTGDIIGMESRARSYPGLLALLIRLRDHTCRTPWCDAPIRHIDHIKPHARGGPTSERNGDGLCARCNYTREHPDHHDVTGDATAITTRVGSLVATSNPPAPPGQPPPTRSRLERRFIDDLTWRLGLLPLPDPGEPPGGHNPKS